MTEHSIDRPRDRYVPGFRAPADLVDAIEEIRATEGRSRSDLIVRALDFYVTHGPGSGRSDTVDEPKSKARQP